jgi:hypothetical protein
MITILGIIAGEILSLLENADRAMSVREIVSELEEPQEVVLMTIGWLARQGFISIMPVSGDYTVRIISEASTVRRLNWGGWGDAPRKHEAGLHS